MMGAYSFLLWGQWYSVSIRAFCVPVLRLLWVPFLCTGTWRRSCVSLQITSLNTTPSNCLVEDDVHFEPGLVRAAGNVVSHLRPGHLMARIERTHGIVDVANVVLTALHEVILEPLGSDHVHRVIGTLHEIIGLVHSVVGHRRQLF